MREPCALRARQLTEAGFCATIHMERQVASRWIGKHRRRSGNTFETWTGCAGCGRSAAGSPNCGRTASRGPPHAPYASPSPTEASGIQRLSIHQACPAPSSTAARHPPRSRRKSHASPQRSPKRIRRGGFGSHTGNLRGEGLYFCVCQFVPSCLIPLNVVCYLIVPFRSSFRTSL